MPKKPFAAPFNGDLNFSAILKSNTAKSNTAIKVGNSKGTKVQVEAEVVVVTKKGQTTIPVKLRKKYKIEEGTKLAVIRHKRRHPA